MTVLLALLFLSGPLWAQGDADFDETRRMMARIKTLSDVLEPVVETLRTEACNSGAGTQVVVTSVGNVSCEADVINWEKRARTERQREFLIGGLHDLQSPVGGPVRAFRDSDGKGYLVCKDFVGDAKTLAELKRNGALYDGFDVFMAVGVAKGTLWLKSKDAEAMRLGEAVEKSGFDGNMP